MLVLFALLDHLRELVAVDLRHADIEHDDREVVGEQCQQRFVGRLGAHQPVVRRSQHRLERIEIARLIVDEENVGRFAHTLRSR